MNQEYLENLLTRAKKLKSFDKDEGEDLKIKTIEAFKTLFSTDFEANSYLQKNNFSYSPVENTSFRDTKNKLISLLEAKIDVLRYKNISLNPAANYAHKTIPDNELIKSYQKKMSSANEAVLKAQIIIDTLQKEAHALKNKIISERKLRIFKDVSLGCVFIAGSFSLGYYFGNNRFDNEKLELSQKVIKQQNDIDSLQSRSKSK